MNPISKHIQTPNNTISRSEYLAGLVLIFLAISAQTSNYIFNRFAEVLYEFRDETISLSQLYTDDNFAQAFAQMFNAYNPLGYLISIVLFFACFVLVYKRMRSLKAVKLISVISSLSVFILVRFAIALPSYILNSEFYTDDPFLVNDFNPIEAVIYTMSPFYIIGIITIIFTLLKRSSDKVYILQKAFEVEDVGFKPIDYLFKIFRLMLIASLIQIVVQFLNSSVTRTDEVTSSILKIISFISNLIILYFLIKLHNQRLYNFGFSLPKARRAVWSTIVLLLISILIALFIPMVWISAVFLGLFKAFTFLIVCLPIILSLLPEKRVSRYNDQESKKLDEDESTLTTEISN